MKRILVSLIATSVILSLYGTQLSFAIGPGDQIDSYQQAVTLSAPVNTNPGYAATQAPLTGLSENTGPNQAAGNGNQQTGPRVDCGNGALAGCNTSFNFGSIFGEGISRVINYIIFAIGLVTFAFIVKGAIGFILALGVEDKMAKAQKEMIAAAIGLVIALLSYAIVALVTSFQLPSASQTNSISQLPPHIEQNINFSNVPHSDPLS